MNKNTVTRRHYREHGCMTSHNNTGNDVTGSKSETTPYYSYVCKSLFYNSSLTITEKMYINGTIPSVKIPCVFK